MQVALLLAEIKPGEAEKDVIGEAINKLREVAKNIEAELIEAQVTSSHDKIFAIFDQAEPSVLKNALSNTNINLVDLAEVRLVGATLEEVKNHAKNANYLVEWDLPEGLTMDKYLARKKEKAPLYSKVPEVKFRRTYVREDMEKCLCFYEAEDEVAVKKAREVVEAPIDRLHSLDKNLK